MCRNGAKEGEGEAEERETRELGGGWGDIFCPAGDFLGGERSVPQNTNTPDANPSVAYDMDGDMFGSHGGQEGEYINHEYAKTMAQQLEARVQTNRPSRFL